MSALFNIAFKGEVADGFSAGDVRDLFLARFPHNHKAIDHLFSGNTVTIAKNMDWDRACAAAEKLRSIGAIVYVVDQDGNFVSEAWLEPANDPLAASGAYIGQHPDEVELGDDDETSEVEALDATGIKRAIDEAEIISGRAALVDVEPLPKPAPAPEAAPEPAAQPDDTVEPALPAVPDDTPVVEQSAADGTPDSAAEEATSAESDNTDPYDLTATAKVRHLTQITDKRVIEETPVADERRTRWRYRFDTFMAKGGGSIFKALTGAFVATFVVIAALRGVLVWLAPDIAQQHDTGFWGSVYITFLELTDPGNMAQDIYSDTAYKVYAVIAGLAGIVMLSALIAFITTAMDQKIYELKRGRSKVIEDDHTLILGWNEQRIVEILRELVLANESEDDACVVILADKDKEEMDDVLRLRVPETATTRIVTRSGDVSSIVNLDMVSLESCRSVVILADCEDTDDDDRKASSDAKAIQTVLATMGNDVEGDGYSVVVEIFNPTHREIVRSSFPEHVITVNTSDILAKLLVQTSRSVGLSIVYNEILSFDGCELYFYDAEWGDSTFGELGYRFPDGVPLGIRDVDGRIEINPDPQRMLEPQDDILILADDDSTIELFDKAVAAPADFEPGMQRNEQTIERELMIGWSFKSAAIIREFADYISEGSQIHVLLKRPSDAQIAEIEALNEELEAIDVELLVKDCLNIEDLMSVRPFQYDNIIILAGNSPEADPVDAARVDSENIVALLLLRRIFSQYPAESRDTKLITEILDSQNDALVAKAGVQDVIISNRLVSMIMAQISESRDIEKVYDDLFQEDGSEIYLKPVSLYFREFPQSVTFADLMAIAQKRDEICLGVKITALEADKNQNNGITLIPEKNTVYELKPEDNLVVVAEDEL